MSTGKRSYSFYADAEDNITLNSSSSASVQQTQQQQGSPSSAFCEHRGTSITENSWVPRKCRRTGSSPRRSKSTSRSSISKQEVQQQENERMQRFEADEVIDLITSPEPTPPSSPAPPPRSSPLPLSLSSPLPPSQPSSPQLAPSQHSPPLPLPSRSFFSVPPSLSPPQPPLPPSASCRRRTRKAPSEETSQSPSSPEPQTPPMLLSSAKTAGRQETVGIASSEEDVEVDGNRMARALAKFHKKAELLSMEHWNGLMVAAEELAANMRCSSSANGGRRSGDDGAAVSEQRSLNSEIRVIGIQKRLYDFLHDVSHGLQAMIAKNVEELNDEGS